MHGRGTVVGADGERHVGTFEKNLYRGYGTHTHPTGEKFVGEFKDDSRHGHGVFTRANGERYAGQWKDDLPSGDGTYTFSNGKEVVGKWQKGLPWAAKEYESDGTLIGTYSKGRLISKTAESDDEREAGQEHGSALSVNDERRIWTWKTVARPGSPDLTEDEKKAFEEYQSPKRNGHGTKTERNGSVYEGEFKDGVFHGQGTYTSGKGDWEGHKCIGEFKDGAQWNATDYDANGDVIATWKNGTRLRVIKKHK
jgi:hypothetical protein